MRAVFLVLMLGSAAFGQIRILSPTAEFNLNAPSQSRPNQPGRNVRSYLRATPDGPTFVTIGHNEVRFASADLEGRILFSKSDLVSVHAQFYNALLRPDGSFWLVSSGPYDPANEFVTATDLGSALPAKAFNGHSSTGPVSNYDQLDLYDRTGEHLVSLRLLAQFGGFGSPVAAASDGRLILRGTGFPGHVAVAGRSQMVHFGTAVGGKFTEQAQARLMSPFTASVAVLASNGDLILIDKRTGEMQMAHPNAQPSTVVRLANPVPVQAAATDSDFIYLLSGNNVMKTNLAGELLGTYQFQSGRQFEPSILSVTGSSLYLADKTGHVARFELN